VLGRIADGGAAAASATKAPSKAAAAAAAPAPPPPAVASRPTAKAPAPAPASAAAPAAPAARNAPALSPSVRRIVEERSLDPAAITGTGPGGRILKEDALREADARTSAPLPEPPMPEPEHAARSTDGDHIVPMSRIRLKIAERMVQAQHTSAILTTFNEIDMSRVMDVRARYKDAFEKKHGVKLGFMSFFARACVQALADVPAVNAEIRGTDIVFDLAGLEREIARLAGRARDNQLTPQELSGGTFTITNGGVFGSLLSTPILNPPQSGILGMHKIEKRPVVVDDQVVVRPMMYVALSYDHRLIDGAQAVTFLVRVKERLEDPERMLLAV